jgi:GH25 family lysozyme M1 (1,4-beta-N-acetylmuramidase)
MKLTSIIAGLGLLAASALATVPGFDVSNHQSSVNFAGAYSSGARFVIIKATEGTTFKDPKFSSHYTAATKAGLIRGGYHFARPASSTGAVQAEYFYKNGGGWSADGITLPGMLDMEAASSTSECHGLTQAQMVAWITSFVNKYHELSGRYPLIYTGYYWWVDCTGNSTKWSTTSPLVLARYSSTVGTMPGGWPYQTIWQFNDKYAYGGDSDVFNGSLDRLKALAKGS